MKNTLLIVGAGVLAFVVWRKHCDKLATAADAASGTFNAGVATAQGGGDPSTATTNASPLGGATLVSDAAPASSSADCGSCQTLGQQSGMMNALPVARSSPDALMQSAFHPLDY